MEGAFASIHRGAAEWWLHSWGSQMDLVKGMETGRVPFFFLTHRSSTVSQGSEARIVVFFPQEEGSTLRLSSSEEVNVEDPLLPRLCARFGQSFSIPYVGVRT